MKPITDWSIVENVVGDLVVGETYVLYCEATEKFFAGIYDEAFAAAGFCMAQGFASLEMVRRWSITGPLVAPCFAP